MVACVCNRVFKAVDVPKDGFLNEQNVAAGLLDLLDNVEYVLPFVTQHAVHLCVVRHYHLIVHLLHVTT